MKRPYYGGNHKPPEQRVGSGFDPYFTSPVPMTGQHHTYNMRAAEAPTDHSGPVVWIMRNGRQITQQAKDPKA